MFLHVIEDTYMYISHFCIIWRKQPIGISTIQISILSFERWIRKSMSDLSFLIRPIWPQNCLRIVILYNCFLIMMVQLHKEDNIHRPQRRGDIIPCENHHIYRKKVIEDSIKWATLNRIRTIKNLFYKCAMTLVAFVGL